MPDLICPQCAELWTSQPRDPTSMNALFYFAGYRRLDNRCRRFALTVPDGAHDRYSVAKELLAKEYPHLAHWSGEFICLTSEDVFKEL